MPPFAEKQAVVTGATSGIGKAVAAALAAAGCEVHGVRLAGRVLSRVASLC